MEIDDGLAAGAMVGRVTAHSKGLWSHLCLVAQSTTAPGGRLNKKDGLTRYGDSHVKDKTS